MILMNVSFKFYSQKLVCFLALLLCTQGVATEINEASNQIHKTIVHFKVEQEVDKLLLLIQKRLVIMHEVARTKWNQNLPIEDKVREQQVLTALACQASQHGLDEKLVVRFFHAQIEASKEIQRKDFIVWSQSSGLKFEKIFSLKDELRFYIDQLNQEMIGLLSKIYRQSFDVSKSVLDHPISLRNSDYIDSEVWSLAISPLKNSQ